MESIIGLPICNACYVIYQTNVKHLKTERIINATNYTKAKIIRILKP
ncbi:uncharacterized protein RAG0_04265 [Rhynchosporium agropyri]|uniref:Uncharacterized protein n=2 Tax=Rhynchosporium TaxID=38037 RepID=A0A1E1MK79_RHYSE|nr:uncharacterized protein RAG0_04265 [Rhynchosporium agropyri]CZT49502.1 uncharacterized protein RSE6_10360 [Rhynchosporium secalis]